MMSETVPSCPGTFLIKKYKNYYDLDIKVSVLSTVAGIYGVVWRFTDMFNYYALEISGNPKFIRCVKVVGGKYTEVAKLDG